MKKRSLLGFIILCFLVQRVRHSTYDQGYEDAWEDEDEHYGFWTTQEYKDGYEDGLYDSEMYDDGFYDGYYGKKPQYLDDSDYMDGYKDGKEHRER